MVKTNLFDILEHSEADDSYSSSESKGEVNPYLLGLKHFNYLDLRGISFGFVPTPGFLCQMTSLTYLNLSNVGFNGEIPQQIGNLSNDFCLDLREAASGIIPYQIGNLTKLLSLSL
ncbi:hypothetical protein VNO78_12315 [Psophocarpus tetragonolobus]|uniref:Uncharacterized protein n=1 Tax=Psophocarpus tetragonolobus TaxID=3891 RepID=A0AAN9XP57_PSOTE